MSDRAEMHAALKEVVVAELRERGFKGTYPAFRRKRADHIDLFKFQFDTYKPEFLIEIAQCSLDGIVMSWGKHIPPSKVGPTYVDFRHRMRIIPQRADSVKGINEVWFDYYYRSALFVAETVLPYLDEAEQWWAQAPRWWDKGTHEQ